MIKSSQKVVLLLTLAVLIIFTSFITLDNHLLSLVNATFNVSTFTHRSLNTYATAHSRNYNLQPVKILDSFDEQSSKGSWWDSDGTKVYMRSIDRNIYHTGGHSMKTEYNKSSGDRWSFFAFHPKQNDVDNDFYTYSEIVFWVYASDRQQIMVKIETSRGGYEKRINITQTHRWQRVIFNFRKPWLHLSKVKNILFFAQPGQVNVKGTFYLDDVFLISRDLLAYIDPATLETPDIKKVAQLGPSRYKISWNETAGRGLYELLVADNPSFDNPIHYWTSQNDFVLTKVTIGTRYYKVRAWTGLPREWGHWGVCSSWSQTSQLISKPKSTTKILTNFDFLDDLEKAWWGPDGREVYKRRISKKHYHTGGYSMRVQYAKTPGYEWSYFAYKTGQDEDFKDFSDYEHLILWVYTQEKLDIQLKLEDESNHTWEQIKPAKSVNKWHKLVFDISGSGNMLDLAHISNVLFFVEPGVSKAKGKFYLDDIFLASTEGFLGSPNSPKMNQSIKESPDNFKLSWSDESTSGAVLYQVLKDRATTFQNPAIYWTNKNHLTIKEIRPGDYYYKVRAWTHLPSYGGKSSRWSNIVSKDLSDISPKIESVTSWFIDDTDNTYGVGSLPRIAVYEKYRAPDITGGTLQIVSTTGDYISESIGLVQSEDGNYYYGQWNTRGLRPGTYRVIATLTDAAGNSDTDRSLEIRLTSSLPLDYNTLTSSVDLPIPGDRILKSFVRTYDLRWANMRGVRRAEKVLGNGWSHNYNVLLFEYSDGSIEVQWGTGRVDYFVKTGGEYKNIVYQDYYPLLIKKPDHSFLLRKKNNKDYCFDATGKLTAIKDSNGNEVTLNYGGDGLLSRIVGPGGKGFSLKYYRNRLISVTGPKGNTLKYDYNSKGNLTKVSKPDGSTTTYVYNDQKLLVEKRDSQSRSTYFEYNSQGQLIKTYNNDHLSIVQISRDPSDSQMTLIDASGNKTTYVFDSWGNIVRILDSTGQVSLSRDKRGNLTNITDQRGNEWELTYDRKGNILTVTNPLNQTTRFSWDSVFNKITELVNAKGHRFQANYDDRGNLISSTDPLRNVPQYEYDDRGNLIKKIDPSGQVTQYEYTSSNGLSKVIYPDGSTEIYKHDDRGNTIEKRDRAGNTIKYRYNYRKQLTAKIYPNGTSAEYGYDSLGNLVWARNARGKISFSYDGANRHTRTTYPNGKSIVYEYDSAGNVTSLTYPDGTKISYTYDKQGRMTSMTDLQSGNKFRFKYDDLGRRTKLVYPNGCYVTYEYDPVGHLTLLSFFDADQTLIQKRSYRYDSIDNVIGLATKSGNYSYSYDNLSRLVGVTPPNGQVVRYHYDSVGNRILVQKGDTSISYETNVLDQYTQVGEINYDYDANGNLSAKATSGGIISYHYDYENRLTEVSWPDGRTLEYKYDPLGRRSQKIYEEKAVNYLYAGDQVIMELNNQGKMRSRYIWGPKLDELLMVKNNSSVYYCLSDRLGNIIAVMNDSGDIVETYKYDAFGLPTIFDSNGQIKKQPVQPFMFAGRPYNSQTGLYYYRARYYSPKLGRFISPDPIARVKDNLYIYAFNNPANYVDPFGLLVGFGGNGGPTASPGPYSRGGGNGGVGRGVPPGGRSNPDMNRPGSARDKVEHENRMDTYRNYYNYDSYYYSYHPSK